MTGGLFDSMVTLRPGPSGRDGAHLGLGLYIVRLVAEFHGGRVRAANLSREGGARFEVEVLLP
jgi:signal transduction histidine kinase